MKSYRNIVAGFILSVVVLLYCCPVFADNVMAEFQFASGKALTGDIRPVLSFFDSIDDIHETKFANIYEKYQRRFKTQEERFTYDDPFITRLSAL